MSDPSNTIQNDKEIEAKKKSMPSLDVKREAWESSEIDPIHRKGEKRSRIKKPKGKEESTFNQR